MRFIYFIVSFIFSCQAHATYTKQEAQDAGFTDMTFRIESPEQLRSLTDHKSNEAHRRDSPINANYGEDRKEKLALEKIIRRNFIRIKDGFYIPKEKCEAGLENELRRFTKIFDYDNDLKVMVALYFYNQKINYREARTLIAEAIFSEDYQTELFNNEIPEHQRSTLKYYFEKYTSDLPVNLDFFNTFHKGHKQYMHIKKILDNKNADTNIKLHFLQDCKAIFYDLAKGENPIYLDAFFCIIKRQRILYPWPSLIEDLTVHLYDDLESKKICPPTIKLSYAKNYLIQKKKYTQAISLYQPILGDEEDSNPDNFFQTPDNYNNYATCLLMDKQYESSRRALRKAVALTSHPSVEWNYSVAGLNCGNYDDNSLKILKKIKNFSVEEKKKYNIDSSIVERTYEQFLDEKERMERLLADQQKILDKMLKLRKQQAAIVKLAVEENQQLKLIENAANVPEKRTTTPPTTTAHTPPYLVSYDHQDCWSSSKNEEKYKASEIKEKIKTRGIPDPTKAIIQNEDQESKNIKPSLIYIEDLTTNKNARTTFEKLFWKYRSDILSDSNVSITRTEIKAMFKTLDLEYDEEYGKGSHVKGTINLQAYGSLMGDQMIILPTHTTDLKPEHIKSLRIAFIYAGVVPNNPELIERLKKDGFNL